MDSHLCNEICTRVGLDDDLWIVGDFAFGADSDRDRVAERFHSLPGRKHLVIGNHDKAWIRDLPWESVRDIAYVDDNGQLFVLCHYPMITWLHARRGAIQLFGHVHQNWAGSRNAVNVGVDQWQFGPVTRRDILQRAAKLPVNKHWADVEPRTGAED